MTNSHDVHAVVTEQLRTIFELWFQSIDDLDASFVDRYMADDFRYLDYSGNVVEVDQYKKLYAMLSRDTKGFHRIETFDVRALGGGGVALATGVYHAVVVLLDGSRIEQRLSFVSVWERQGDSWRARVHQTVAMPKPAT